ncbi:hypothetical protein OC834_001840 [Tilletia horrida]|nr:hypothetical protein OC834_001840 [Tilletia horrida]
MPPRASTSSRRNGGASAASAASSTASSATAAAAGSLLGMGSGPAGIAAAATGFPASPNHNGTRSPGSAKAAAATAAAAAAAAAALSTAANPAALTKNGLPDGLNMHPTFAFSMAASIPYSLPIINTHLPAPQAGVAAAALLSSTSSSSPSSVASSPRLHTLPTRTLTLPIGATPAANLFQAASTSSLASSSKQQQHALPLRRPRKQLYPFLMPSQAALQALNSAAIKIIPSLPAKSDSAPQSPESPVAQPLHLAKRPRKMTAVRSPSSASTFVSTLATNSVAPTSTSSSSSSSPSSSTPPAAIKVPSSTPAPTQSTTPTPREIHTSDSPWGRCAPPTASAALRRNCFALANDRYPGAPGTALDKARKEVQRAEAAAKREASRKLQQRAELEHLGVKGLAKKRKSASPYASTNQQALASASTSSAAAHAAAAAKGRGKGKGRASATAIPAESNPHPGSRSRRPPSRASSPAVSAHVVNGISTGSAAANGRVTRSSSEDRIALPNNGSNGHSGAASSSSSSTAASGASISTRSPPLTSAAAAAATPGGSNPTAAQIFLGSAAAGHAPLRSSPLASHVITTALDHDEEDDEAGSHSAKLQSGSSSRRAGTPSRSRSRESSPLRAVTAGSSGALKRKASALSKEVLPDGSDSDSPTPSARDAIVA